MLEGILNQNIRCGDRNAHGQYSRQKPGKCRILNRHFFILGDGTSKKG
jgi:hypothetical protein